LPVFKTGALNRSANLPLLTAKQPQSAIALFNATNRYDSQRILTRRAGLETDAIVPYSNKAVLFDRNN
jgi:hypothetical protein